MSSSLESHRHCVKFYENDASLFNTVGEFLAQGLVDGHPAIVIATPEHLRGITENLAGHLIDIGKAARSGRLVVMDAEETLRSFMIGDMPDADAFAREVGDVVANSVTASGGHAVVRAYGEMVDILWREGRHDAAIRLEMLWNRLAGRHQFSLLCAYAMGSFYKETDLLERVCAEHTHVLPPFDVPDGTTVH